MDAERLFLYTYADLSDRLGRDHPLYVYLRAAALLRQLLVDGAPLYVEANRRTKLKVAFPVLDWQRASIDPLKGPFLISDPNMEETPGGLAEITEPLNRDAFLHRPIGSDGTHSVRVLDVISYVAEQMGGVHKGPTTRPGDEVFASIDQHLSFPRVPDAGLAAIIEQISRCVIWGLRPLNEALTETHGPVGKLAPVAPIFERHPEAGFIINVVRPFDPDTKD